MFISMHSHIQTLHRQKRFKALRASRQQLYSIESRLSLCRETGCVLNSLHQARLNMTCALRLHDTHLVTLEYEKRWWRSIGIFYFILLWAWKKVAYVYRIFYHRYMYGEPNTWIRVSLSFSLKLKGIVVITGPCRSWLVWYLSAAVTTIEDWVYRY